VTPDISTKELFTEMVIDSFKPEGVILRHLLSSGESQSKKILHPFAGDDGIPCLFSVIEPSFNSQVILKLGLNFMNLTIILPGKDSTASFNWASFNEAGSG
jgi:hypothetical protein